MRENEFLDGIGNVDPDVVERFVSMDQRLKAKKRQSELKRKSILIAALAACFVLVAGATVFFSLQEDNGPGVIPAPDSVSSSETTASPGSTADNDDPSNIRPLHWSDVSSLFGISADSKNTNSPSDMYEKAFCEIISGVYSDYVSGDVISDDYVGAKIGTAVIKTGWYQSWNGEERDVYEVNAEIYQIKEIDTKIAIAIKYLEKTHADTTEFFYVYSNPLGCDPASLADFYEAYDASKHMQIYSNAHIRIYNENSSSTLSVYKINEETLATINSQILELDSSASYSKYNSSDLKEIESIIKSCKERLQISVKMKSAGRHGVAYVLDNGYICFVGFGEFFSLHAIGSDEAKNLIEEVKSNSVCINSSAGEVTSSIYSE